MFHRLFWQRARRLGPFVVDSRRGRLSRRGRPVKIGARTFTVLDALMSCTPGALNADELKRRAWGRAGVTDDALKQQIRLLRRALGDDARAPRLIGSTPDGYRILEPVRAVTPWAANPVRYAVAAVLAIGALSTVGATAIQQGPTSRVAIADFGFYPDRQAPLADTLRRELTSALAARDRVVVVDTSAGAPADFVVDAHVRRTRDVWRVIFTLTDAKTREIAWTHATEVPVGRAKTLDRELVATFLHEAPIA